MPPIFSNFRFAALAPFDDGFMSTLPAEKIVKHVRYRLRGSVLEGDAELDEERREESLAISISMIMTSMAIASPTQSA